MTWAATTCNHDAIRRILRPGPRFCRRARRGGPLPFALVVVVCGMLAGGCAGHAAASGPGDASGSADASSGTGGDDGTNLDAPDSGDSSSDGPMDLEGEGGSRDAGLSDSGDGATCVDIDASSYDVSCKQNTDCIAIFSGPLCSGYNCVCPGRAAINMSGQARYESVRSSIHPGEGPLCSCPAAPEPQCLGGVCTVCNGFRDDPPACHSALSDAAPDGSACVGGGPDDIRPVLQK